MATLPKHAHDEPQFSHGRRCGSRVPDCAARRLHELVAPSGEYGYTYGQRCPLHKRYSVAEAKNQLPAVLHAVELGDPVEITRHGRAVAVVLSFEQYHQLRGSKPDLWPAYQSWLARRAALDDDDVDALADATRATEPGARVDW